MATSRLSQPGNLSSEGWALEPRAARRENKGPPLPGGRRGWGVGAWGVCTGRGRDSSPRGRFRERTEAGLEPTEGLVDPQPMICVSFAAGVPPGPAIGDNMQVAGASLSWSMD